MVKLLMVTLYRHMGEEKHPIKLASAQDLSQFGFFTRGTIAEHCQFASRTVCQRTSPGQKQTVDQKDENNPFVIHVYVQRDGLSCVCVSDKEYPLRVVFSFIQKVMAAFEKASNEGWKRIEKDQDLTPEFLQKDLSYYQDPNQADKIMQIQKSLDDIKDIMHKNIDEVLKRGETLDSLMEKSEDLSATSVQFYKKAKKNNQCCKAY